MSAVQGVLLLGFLLHLWPPGSVQGALVVSRYDGVAEVCQCSPSCYYYKSVGRYGQLCPRLYLVLTVLLCPS